MGDGPEHEVERASYWRSIEKRHRALIGAALAVAVLAVAAAVGLSAEKAGREDGAGETSGTITPAQETSETTVPVATDGVAPEGSVGQPGAGDGAAAGTTAYVRAPLVAYRRNGTLCVAAEDGSGERAVVASADGTFALSPDGTLIAFVESSSGMLALADVVSGAVSPVGAATQDAPSWAPDSAWLVYSAPGPAVMRVARSGAGASQILEGSMPSASVADGTVVAAAASGEMAVWRSGMLTLLPAPGTITGLATDGSSVWCGALSSGGQASLCVGGLAGGERRVVVAAPVSTRAVTFSDLVLSPDAAQLVFAEQGDDGYSRMFAVPSGGGEAEALSVRRDCYPLRWTADGASVAFIEGNAFQGDPTSLMRVDPSGASRRLLVDGARR